MAFLSSLNIVGSGLTAQQLRLDLISENITNINTTRTEQGGAYRRKMTVLEAEGGRDSFRRAMAQAEARSGAGSGARAGAQSGTRVGTRGEAGLTSNRGFETAGGVHVAAIAEDPSELPLVYDPTHPDANENGYVEMPNVTLVKEMTDAMAASQAYSANVTALNTLKSVISKGLEIGK